MFLHLINKQRQVFNYFISSLYNVSKKVRRDNSKEKYPILDEIDFEAELIHRDQINVAYILTLLKQYVQIDDENAKALKLKQIKDILSSSVNMKSKRELIEKFIEKHSLSVLEEDLEDEFDRFLDAEKQKQLEEICTENKLDFDKAQNLISEMLYYGNMPNAREEMLKTFITRPSLFEIEDAVSKLTEQLDDFLETFYEKGVA